MKKQMIKFSIVITAYNIDKYLKECIDSVRNQDLDTFELIIVNDGSTDNTKEICSYYEKLDNVIIINQDNQGVSCARNNGMAKSSGKYIAFLDGDDYYKDNSILSRIYNYMEYNQLELCRLAADNYYEEHLEIIPQNFYSINCEKIDVVTGLQLFNYLSKNNNYRGSSCIHTYRTDLLKKNNIMFEEGLVHEDHLFTISAYCFAKKASFLSEICYIRRVRSHSIMTSKVSFKNVYGHLHAYLGFLKLIDNEEINIQLKDSEIMNEYSSLMYSLICNAQIYLLQLSDYDIQQGMSNISLQERAILQTIIMKPAYEQKRLSVSLNQLENIESKYNSIITSNRWKIIDFICNLFRK